MDAWKLCKAKFFFNESSFRYLVVKTTAFLPRTILKLYEKFKTIRQPFCGLGGSCWRFNANILWECSWWQRREHHCTKLYIAWPFSLFFFSLSSYRCAVLRVSAIFLSFFFLSRPFLYFIFFFFLLTVPRIAAYRFSIAYITDFLYSTTACAKHAFFQEV